MLDNLSPDNKNFLRHCFNLSLSRSFVPDDWRKAIILPWLKADKPPSSRSSYRPVALTSNVCKAMERIISNRLQWFMEVNGLHQSAQAGFRKGRSTMDHIVQLELDIKRGFANDKSTIAVFLDIDSAYVKVWTQGLLFKLAKLGISGCFLGWIGNFLTGRSFCVRIGSFMSDFRSIENGVPQGAVVSPTLFNIMMSDFPKPVSTIKTLLYADDISFYTQVSKSIEAEIILQPYLEEIYRWGLEWKFNFPPEKSSAVVFTRRSDPGNDPIIFMHGHRINFEKKVKFLGVVFDYKLLWKDHIDLVYKHCFRLKNLFATIASLKSGPSLKILSLLFTSLVQSKIDYGLIAYGSAAASNLKKLDVISRAIIRIILGSRSSTPVEMLYTDLAAVPVQSRRQWLSRKYLINLSSKPFGSTFTSAKFLFHQPSIWPKFKVPCLSEAIVHARQHNLPLFQCSRRNTFPPLCYHAPSEEQQCKVLWFPMNKKQSVSNSSSAVSLFCSLVQRLPSSVSGDKRSSACAIVIPEWNVEKSWSLSQGTSIFSAELIGVLKVLECAIEYPVCPVEIVIFIDSSSAIKAIISTGLSLNEIVFNIRQSMVDLHSRGTRIKLVWIPSHIGISGNETADRLARQESETPSANVIDNRLSASELCSLQKVVWTDGVIRAFKASCQKKSVHMKSNLRHTKWHFCKIRQVSVCLHRLRAGHHFLNSFRHRIDDTVNPKCRQPGCQETLEDEAHCILICPAHQIHRSALQQFFANHNLPWNLDSILGLNTELNSATQFKIRDLLISFLQKSGLDKII